jgi:hypothetical protein
MTTLDELEKLLEATQGEKWRVSNRDPVRVVDGTGAYIALCDPHHKGDPLQETRAALIVAAINALPGLIESARRVKEMQAALKPFAQMADAVDGAKEVEVQITDVDSGESITLVMGTSRFLNARAALKGT